MTNSTSRLPRQVLQFILTRGISALGSSLTTFGLNVWVFRTTGSYEIFAYLAALAAIPSLLFAPFAGIVADRYNKKHLLIASDATSLLAILAVYVMYKQDALSVTIVAVSTLIIALASELRWSTMGATISLVAAKEHWGQVNSLQQSFRGIIVMLGPIMGAVGLDQLGLSLLIGIDVLSYMIGILGILPLVVNSNSEKTAETPAYLNFWHELTFGFRWTFARAGLRRLLIFFMIINIGVSIFTVTFSPYILSYGTHHTLGIGLGLQGAGAFLTGIFLARWCKISDDEKAILLGAFAFGVCMILWGYVRHELMVWSVAFALGMLTTIIMASTQTIWQIHVPVSIQGKVFAVRTVLSFGLTPLAIFFSVPMANMIFTPVLQHLTIFSAIWGSGMSASLGLMVSTMGLGVVLASLALLTLGGLRIAVEKPTTST